MIQPKTFAQWLANYIDKPGTRGTLARDWALTGATEDEVERYIEQGNWSDEYDSAAEYYSARRAYAVYCLRHVRRYGDTQ